MSSENISSSSTSFKAALICSFFSFNNETSFLFAERSNFLLDFFHDFL
ncbi:hypothetical protein HOF65_00480 [bacterium]|nr:hypothetical protein [bacterium]MBT3852524.1 hypothetical protein [bacterium]MBT4632689.1 hypothetical protein [bacterium]MBT6778290.1 hypothetical protein [bacterium]